MPSISGEEHPDNSLDTIIENIHSAILNWDERGIILFANSFAGRYFGCTAQELVGKNILVLLPCLHNIPENDVSAFIKALTQHPERYGHVEQEQVQTDGSRHWIAWHTTAIHDRSGVFCYGISSSTDITALKTAEQDAARLALLVESSSDAIFSVDLDGTVMTWNKGAERIYGFTTDEMVGKSIFVTALHPEEIERIIQRIKNREDVGQYETIRQRKDGKQILLSITVSAIRNDSGDPVGIVVVSRDIAERKKAEQIAARLALLVESSDDAIFSMDLEGVVQTWNKGAEHIYGYTADEIIGKNITLTAPGREKEIYLNNERVKRGEKIDHYETVRTHKDGHEITIAATVSSLKGSSGTIFGIGCIARDVSLLKYAEEEIRYLSFHDPVTGLFNRLSFEEEIRRLDHERELPISLIMGDANFLKLTNDMFGHEAGDSLLQRIAAVLTSSCRKNDIIARWGGDEFVIILPRTDTAAAEGVLARIKDECARVTDMVPPPSLALGIATKNNLNENIYQILREAERQQYSNKALESGKNQERIITSLMQEVERNAHETPEHIQRLESLADRFGGVLQLSEQQMRDLRTLAWAHDIGKIRVPGGILEKHQRLLPKEWMMVVEHAVTGFRIARTFTNLASLADILLTLHEHWNGNGYPQGFKGTNIPFLSRVFALIEAYDVMTHDRPYERTFTHQEAIEEIRKNAGTQFDPQLAELFIHEMSG